MGAGEIYYIYYNGPATVRGAHDKENAGLWMCDNNEFIAIEEIVNLVFDNTNGVNRFISIVADCPGAGGIWHRLIHKFERGEMKIWTKINRI